MKRSRYQPVSARGVRQVSRRPRRADARHQGLLGLDHQCRVQRVEDGLETLEGRLRLTG